MQDHPISTYSQMNPQFPEQEHLKCPRCESLHTKFCYYNNYNLSQPRHFCKNCRRYWTKGGSLRNIPMGGGSRKNTKRSSNLKRSSNSTPPPPPPQSAAAAAQPKQDQEPPPSSSASYDASGYLNIQDRSGGSFSSLLEANGNNISIMLEGRLITSPPAQGELADENHKYGLGSSNVIRNSFLISSKSNSESFLGVENGTGDSSCWSGTNGWPDLAI